MAAEAQQKSSAFKGKGSALKGKGTVLDKKGSGSTTERQGLTHLGFW